MKKGDAGPRSENDDGAEHVEKFEEFVGQDDLELYHRAAEFGRGKPADRARMPASGSGSYDLGYRSAGTPSTMPATRSTKVLPR